MPSDTKTNSKQKIQQYIHYFSFFNNEHSTLELGQFYYIQMQSAFSSIWPAILLSYHYPI